MWPVVVVVVVPRLQMGVSFFRVGPVFCIGPFAQGGLDEAFGLAVGSGSVGPGTAVFDLHLLACKSELGRAIT